MKEFTEFHFWGIDGFAATVSVQTSATKSPAGPPETKDKIS